MCCSIDITEQQLMLFAYTGAPTKNLHNSLLYAAATFKMETRPMDQQSLQEMWRSSSTSQVQKRNSGKSMSSEYFINTSVFIVNRDFTNYLTVYNS